MTKLDWTRYPNFSEGEFACSHTGQAHMAASFLDRLQAIRSEFGRPMVITSGYRHPTHPIEAAKPTPGAHATGRACDVRVHGADALRLINIARAHGMTGIGVHQRGSAQARFLHLDDLEPTPLRPRPWIWSY